jgi:DNA-binding transcriptional regulator YiaG
MDFKAIRKELNLNQAQMARACGVHRQTWVKWERGERDLNNAAKRLINILRWLNKRSILVDYLKSH